VAIEPEDDEGRNHGKKEIDVDWRISPQLHKQKRPGAGDDDQIYPQVLPLE
jgi:hypothetical protein